MATPSEPIIYRRPLTLSNSVELYWYPPTNNGGNLITSYIIECSNVSYKNVLPPSDSKSIIRNLVSGNSYVFTIKATNINGNGNISEFNFTIPGFKPNIPTNLDFTNSITNYSQMNFYFNTPNYVGNSNILYSTVTMVPVDITGNILQNSKFIHDHSNDNNSNIINALYHEEFNNNLNYKSYMRCQNTINDSDKTYFSHIMNPSLPTNGLKLWLDPFDLTTLTLSNSKVVKWEDKSKNKSNATINGIYSPNISGLQIWFDGKDTTTMTITNNRITQWRDKAKTYNNLFLQTHDFYVGPNYSTNGLVFNNFNTGGRTNGQSGLRLNNNITIPQTNKAFYFVYNNSRDTNEGYNDILQLRLGFNYEYHIDLGQTNQGRSYYGPFLYTGSAQTLTTVTNWSTRNTFTVLGVFFISNRVYLRVNGTTYTSDITDSINTNNVTYDTLTLGGHTDNRNFTGTVSEILIYQGLTINDTSSYEKIEGYLAWKWGTQSLLPSNHTYKNSPPDIPNNESFAPTYDSSNALINFNGNQFLNLPDYTLPSSNSSYSIFTYVSTSNIERNNQWFLYSGNPLANLSLGGFINSNSIVHSWWTNQLTGNSNISANISYLVENTYDSGIRRTYLNGLLIDQDLVSNRNSDTINNLIGTNSTFTGNLFGSVGDIIIYDRILTNFERNSVKNYLERKKYNLSLQNIGNVITWLDATDTNNLFDINNEIKASYNDYVYNWIDRSYSNNNASQSNIANLPVRRPYIQNNLDVLEFNQSYLTLPTAKYPLDAFIVLKLANISDQNGILGIGPSGNNYSSLSDISGSRWAIDATSNSVISSFTETSSNFLLMEWSIGNNNNYIRRYGSNIANVTTGTWTLPNNSNIFIGNANGFDFSKKFKGYIGEIMMFNKQLDDGERYPIEGYLAWKWGLQSFLSSNHPYKNSAPYLFYKYIVPYSFSPNQINGLAMWFDASDSTTYTTSSGNLISNWSSKNTTSIISVSQSDTNKQPQRVANVRNGLTILRMTNPNSSTFVGLSNSNVASSDITTNTSVAVFIVHNPTYSYSTPFSYVVPLATPDKRLCFVTPEVDNIIFDWNNAGTGSRLSYSLGTGGGNIYNSEGFKLECVYVSNGIQGYRKNGQLITSQSSNTASFNATQTLTIGGFTPDNIQYYYRDDIGEIVWFKSGLSTYEIQKTEGFLAWKWGLQSNLPSNHYFKNASPSINTTFSPAIYSPWSWIDVSDTSTITLSGNNVISISNKGTNGSNVISSNSTQVAYNSANTLNGITLVTVNKDAALVLQASNFTYAGASIFVVIRHLVGTGNDRYTWFLNNWTYNQPQVGLSFGYLEYGLNGVGWPLGSGTAPGVGVNEAAILCFNLSGNSNNALTKNGTSLPLNLSGYDANNINTTWNLCVPYGGGMPSGPCVAIAEHLVFRRGLNTKERQEMEGYLAWKWGLNSSLPSNHPYKNAAPGTVPSNYNIVTSGQIINFSATNYSGSGAWTNIGSLGTSFNATVENGTPSKNTVGNGVVFNGSTNFTFPNIAVGNAWTASLWVKRTGTNDVGGSYLTQVWNNNHLNIGIYSNFTDGTANATTNQITGGFFNATTGWYNPTAFTLELNKWYNICYTWNGTTIRMYVDGISYSSTNPGISSLDGNKPYRIGRRWDQSTFPNYIRGEIGQILIYNRGLSASEVQQNYNATSNYYLV